MTATHRGGGWGRGRGRGGGRRGYVYARPGLRWQEWGPMPPRTSPCRSPAAQPRCDCEYSGRCDALYTYGVRGQPRTTWLLLCGLCPGVVCHRGRSCGRRGARTRPPTPAQRAMGCGAPGHALHLNIAWGCRQRMCLGWQALFLVGATPGAVHGYMCALVASACCCMCAADCSLGCIVHVDIVGCGCRL